MKTGWVVIALLLGLAIVMATGLLGCAEQPTQELGDEGMEEAMTDAAEDGDEAPMEGEDGAMEENGAAINGDDTVDGEGDSADGAMDDGGEALEQ